MLSNLGNNWTVPSIGFFVSNVINFGGYVAGSSGAYENQALHTNIRSLQCNVNRFISQFGYKNFPSLADPKLG